MNKENRKGKENLPPTPPIREREKTKEATQPNPACARACACASARTRPPVWDLSRPPTLDEVLLFSKERKFTDEGWVRDWFDRMENEKFWLDGRTGIPIKVWTSFMGWCYRQDHARGEARPNRGRYSGNVPHAANYLPPDEAVRRSFDF